VTGAISQPPSPSRVALVTGGSRGIGRAIVQGLAKTGTRVHFTYLKGVAQAEETLRLVREAGGWADAAAVDITHESEVEAWVNGVARSEGRIDILVNNAGETVDALLAFQEEANWRRMIAVNLDGVRHACRAVLRSMIAERRGRIINLSSVSAVTGHEGQTAYAAAKGGVLSFTRSLAREVGGLGITVNAVVPGPVETDMMAGVPEAKLRGLLEAIPLKRLARPEEVAAAVIYLASEQASYVTGASLRVDGGLGI
jgi:3-oxoacyl-[acyl-carrier protein] reductase